MAWSVTVLVLLSVCTQVFTTEEVDHTLLIQIGLNSTLQIDFSPSLIEELVQGEESTVYYNITLSNLKYGTLDLFIEVNDEEIAEIVNNNTLEIDFSDPHTWSGNITIAGIFLGRTYLKFSYIKHSNLVQYEATQPTEEVSTSLEVTSRSSVLFKYHVAVIRSKRILDTVFIAVVAIVVLVPKIGMGCKLDLQIVREVLKKPFAPIIGFICQFIIMPGVAYGIIEMLGMKGGLALGYFAAGCAPGGGASNFYAYLLKGDISLSITMTAVSTVASLGMIPMWMFTVGRILIKRSGAHLQVPFLNICITLISIVAPVGIGVLLQYKAPECAKRFGKILRPIMLLFLIFLMTFGVYVNLYVFKLYTWRLVLAGCLLPYMGFIIGALVALACRQPLKRIKTIAIETGVQNLGIAILLMKLSLPQPDADLSLLSPIMVGTFGPLPLLIAVIALEIRKRCCKKGEDPDTKQAELENGSIKEETVELNRPENDDHETKA